MTFYWLAADESDTDWCFYDSTDDLKLRPEYEKHACAECRKVDQYAAIVEEGIYPTFVPIQGLDYQHTADGLPCMSMRMFSELKKAGGTVPQAFSIPADPSNVIVWPRSIAPTDVDNSTVRLHGQACPACGRH